MRSGSRSKTIKYVLLCVLAVVLIYGLAIGYLILNPIMNTAYAPGFSKEAWPALTPGMTMSEVREALGEPITKSVTPYRETWNYDKTGEAVISSSGALGSGKQQKIITYKQSFTFDSHGDFTGMASGKNTVKPPGNQPVNMNSILIRERFGEPESIDIRTTETIFFYSMFKNDRKRDFYLYSIKFGGDERLIEKKLERMRY